MPIILGIVLGLGLSFVMEGIGMMKGQPVVAIITVALTFYLLSHGKIPAMLILLAFGMIVATASNPSLISEINQISARLRVPDCCPTERSRECSSRPSAGFLSAMVPAA